MTTTTRTYTATELEDRIRTVRDAGAHAYTALGVEAFADVLDELVLLVRLADVEKRATMFTLAELRALETAGLVDSERPHSLNETGVQRAELVYELVTASDFELLEWETRLEALITHRLEVDYYGGGEIEDDGEHHTLEALRAETTRRADRGITVSKPGDPSMADLEPYGAEWQREQADRLAGEEL